MKKLLLIFFPVILFGQSFDTIDCNGEGVSQTYEYGDNENVTFSYSNNDGQGLQIVFSGSVENSYDNIYINI